MKSYTYLMIGGGMAADAAVRGIRDVDEAGSIGVLSKENDPPYRRPPLSKSLWTGDDEVDDVLLGTGAVAGVDLLTGCTAIRLDCDRKQVSDQAGQTYSYDRLLLVPGGTPRRLPFTHPRIFYYRTLQDYRQLRSLLPECTRVGVVGGGFIGCEMAAAMKTAGQEVTMIYPEALPGGGAFPVFIAEELANYYEAKGVQLIPGVKPSEVVCTDQECRLKTEDGRLLSVDCVVIGIGIEPQTDLAESAGLDVENGIAVDAWLQTSHPDVFSAGDAASFYNKLLDRRMRVEHEDHALTSGRTAGRNMAGKKERYDHLPYFYSDLFDVGYEAVGELSAEYETETVWNGVHEKGVVAFLDDDAQVRGVLLWNLFGKTDEARQLIATRPSASLSETLRSLFNDS